MKYNYYKTANVYGTNIDGVNYRYGWYKSGKAFIAKEDELMTYKEAYKTFVPKHCFNLSNAFFGGVTKYKKTIDGIVRYLIDKYNS